MSKTQDLLEGFPEFRIENGVDEWVDAWVDIAQPGCDQECRVPGFVLQLVLDADGIDDVAGEEWHPAHQKANWKKK